MKAENSNVLLINPSTIRNLGFIEDITDDTLSLYIKTVQDVIISREIGEELYDDLLTMIRTKEMNADLQILLDSFLKYAVCNFVKSELILTNSSKVASIGTVNTSREYVANTELKEKSLLSNRITEYGNTYLRRLAEFIGANPSVYGKYLKIKDTPKFKVNINI